MQLSNVNRSKLVKVASKVIVPQKNGKHNYLTAVGKYPL